jgi:hypothetical protein
LAVGVAAAGIVTTAALAMAVWPALTRPEPPLEKAGDGGLRIRLIEPPKAAAAPSSPLDVGLSEAAQAMAKGREALFVMSPATRPAPQPTRPGAVQVAQADDEQDDVVPPPEPVDDRWEREAWRRDRFEQAQFERAQFERAQRRRWEEERLAREAEDERAAWSRPPRERRWDNIREQDRYAPAPEPAPDRAPSDDW